jgi:hypothetical protein
MDNCAILTGELTKNTDYVDVVIITDVIPNNCTINCSLAVIDKVMCADYYIKCNSLCIQYEIMGDVLLCGKKIYGPTLVYANIEHPSVILELCPDCIILISDHYFCDTAEDERFLIIKSTFKRKTYINEYHSQYYKLTAEMIKQIKDNYIIEYSKIFPGIDFSDNKMYKNANSAH